jgi:hypothetical protein
MDVNKNAWRKDMKTCREVTEAYPERTETRIKTGQELLEAEIKTDLEKRRQRF